MGVILLVISLYLKIGLGISLIEIIRWAIEVGLPQDPKNLKQRGIELITTFIIGIFLWPAILKDWYLSIKRRLKNEKDVAEE